MDEVERALAAAEIERLTGHPAGSCAGLWRNAPTWLAELVERVRRFEASEAGLAALVRRADAAERERDHWKANHDACDSYLRAEVERMSAILRESVPERHRGCTSPVGAVQNYIGDLEQQVARLRAALEKYGDHVTANPERVEQVQIYDCAVADGKACDCGYDAALRGPAEGE